MSKQALTKKGLADAVAEQLNVTKTEAGRFVDALLDTIKGNLLEGNKVDLAGFGRFEVKRREARSGFNPQTREKIQIPASNTITFKVSKGLKDQVNK